LALACFGGEGGGPTTPYRAELEELRELITVAPDDAKPPPSDRFGYRRQIVRQHIFPRCSIAIPGYYYELPDEGGSAVFAFGRRLIRLSSMILSGGEQAQSSARELVLSVNRSAQRTDELPLRVNPELDAHCIIVREGTLFHAHAVLSRPNRVLVVTITFSDPEDVNWVRDVLATVHLGPPKGE
jgi:hypothetical protein